MQTSLMPSAGSMTYSALSEISCPSRPGCLLFRLAFKGMTVLYRLQRQHLRQF